jgi:hypothetical protein
VQLNYAKDEIMTRVANLKPQRDALMAEREQLAVEESRLGAALAAATNAMDTAHAEYHMLQVCVCVCVCVCLCMGACVCLCVHACMCVCAYLHVCACMFAVSVCMTRLSFLRPHRLRRDYGQQMRPRKISTLRSVTSASAPREHPCVCVCVCVCVCEHACLFFYAWM